MVAFRTEDLFIWRSPQSLQKVVDFRPEDCFFFFFCEMITSVKPLPLQFFACPEKFVPATCLNVTATYF